jgi:hypothetical protein
MPCPEGYTPDLLKIYRPSWPSTSLILPQIDALILQVRREHHFEVA